MRRPIAVQVPLFDVNSIQPEIDAVCGDFERYLSFYPAQASTSKYAVMGPVGKVISQLKSGRNDRPSLKGYALRVHEAKQPFPSLDAIVALDSGIDRLIDILSRPGIPVVAHDRILDRVDFGLYYLRRRREIERRDEYNKALREYLKRKYGTVEALAAAWGSQAGPWERIYAFGQQSKTYARANASKRSDMEGFREERRNTTAEPDIEIDDEEATS